MSGSITCARAIALLHDLPSSRMATNDEVMLYIEHHALMGRGLGFVDAHLLASVVIGDGAVLLTRDAALRSVAIEQGTAFRV